jgi:D-arabinose 1-dehydrogenase-like Zn-dependent alcohol dehydrogenase
VTGGHDSADRHANDVVVELDAISDGVRGSATGVVSSASDRASVLVGKRVLVGAIAPCGDCEVCRRGGASACPFAEQHSFAPGRGDRNPGARSGTAGDAERDRKPRLAGARSGAAGDAERDQTPSQLTTSGRWLVALDQGLELPLPAAAAVAGDVAVAYTLYARTGIGPRDPVVIVGATSVARFVVEIIVAKAGTAVALVPPAAPAGWHDWLLAKGVTALRMGTPADDVRTIDPDVRGSILSAFAAQDVPAKPWAVIAVDDIAQAAQLAGPRATLSVLAPNAPGTLPFDLVAREVTIISVANAHPDLIVEAAAMCVKREIDLEGGVTTTPGDPTRAFVRAP